MLEMLGQRFFFFFFKFLLKARIIGFDIEPKDWIVYFGRGVNLKTSSMYQVPVLKLDHYLTKWEIFSCKCSKQLVLIVCMLSERRN